MKIAICKSSLFGPISGADETLVAYASELHRLGHHVSVLLIYASPRDDTYRLRLEKVGIPIVVIASGSSLFLAIQVIRRIVARLRSLVRFSSIASAPVRGVWQSLVRGVTTLYRPRLVAYLGQRPFDVLHVLTPDSGSVVLIEAGHAAGVPVLYQELGTPFHMPGLGEAYERLARVTPLCASITALSPILAEQWDGRLPHGSKTQVLPLLVPPLPHREGLTPRVQRRAIFGFAGRLEPGKGPGILLEAFASLGDGPNAVSLRIAGSGPLARALHRQAGKLGIGEMCEFTGNFKGPEGRAAFLATLDIFVLPSFAEGTPNSIIEAMAMGLPVIASDVGGIPDLVTEDTGITVPPGEPAALADAMARLATDPALRAQMGRAARRRYQQLFSPGSVVPALVSTYERLAGCKIADAVDAGDAPPTSEMQRSATGAAHPWLGYAG